MAPSRSGVHGVHGTCRDDSQELILSILHEGFNASLSKGTFGDGCYFAEDPVARIRGLRFVFRSACCACKG